MLLAIDGLRASRGGAEVLHDVRLHLDRGEIYGLLGPNGAGKSTTIAVLLGLLRRDGGQIALFGADPETAGPSVRARLGVLPERNGFYDWMGAEAYLRFFAELHGREADSAACGRLLAQVGLDGHRRERIGRFSRGMRQRLGLARALIGSPELLILDEPTNGLDPRGRRELHDLLQEMARSRGVAVLMCTHLLDDVERLCQRAGLIVEGRTVAEGRLSDLTRRHGGQARYRLRLARPDAAGLPVPAGVAVLARDREWCEVELARSERADSLWPELHARGWPIVEIHAQEAGLEALYLSLTERRAA